MSQSSNGSRSSRRRPPPERLGWPIQQVIDVDCDHDDVEQNQHSPKLLNNQVSHNNPRRVTFSGGKGMEHTKRQKQAEQQHALWSVKHAPKTSVDLCVAPKKVKEITEWLTASQHPQFKQKLLLLIGSPGIGKSAMIHCVAAELGLEVHEWTESFSTNRTSNGTSTATTIQQLTPLNSFEYFLQQAGAGYKSLKLEVESTMRPKKKQKVGGGSIIAIDEMPHLHTADAISRFRDIMTAHVHRTNVPTVLIYSDAAEGKVQSSDLERLVDKHSVYSQYCKIVQINAPTLSKSVKAIRRIAMSEGAKVSSDYLEALHVRCDGDLRFAIATLQFELVGTANVGSRRIKQHLTTTTSTPTRLRDANLMPFHALGKLLYAKREKSNGKVQHEQRSQLDFNPELVIEQSEMEVGNVLHFLGYHCVDFFTDIDDLSMSLDFFSDATVLIDHPLQTMTNVGDALPTSFATSLAGRAVAYTNHHPAPTSFRSFGAPKVFDVIRLRKENAIRIHTLCTKSSNWTTTASGCTTNAACFATDMLPFVRAICPKHHQINSSFLSSFFDRSAGSDLSSSERTAWDEEQQKEQDEILNVDDIVELDDDDDDW